MSNHRTPAWRVTLDGRDLTSTLAPRLLELTLTEHRGGEADALTLQLHDHDGRLALPNRGAELTVALGWQGGALVDKGKFRVDELEHSGAPDRLMLRARSADLTAAIRQRRERSWDQTTLGELLKAIAGEHGLNPRIAADLAQIAIPHLDQTESDANLLTRLGKHHDAVATIKAGRLLFFPSAKPLMPPARPCPLPRFAAAMATATATISPTVTPTAAYAPIGTTRTVPTAKGYWWGLVAMQNGSRKPSPVSRKRNKWPKPSGNASSGAWPP